MAMQKSRFRIGQNREFPSHEEIVHDEPRADRPAILRVSHEAVFSIKSDRGEIVTVDPQFDGGGSRGDKANAEEVEGLGSEPSSLGFRKEVTLVERTR
jgi:hypothetical protein